MHAVTRRDNKWDFIKGMLIVFVVWGHLCSYISNSSYEKNILTTYIRLFQMPLFIFVSGYFAKGIESFGDYIYQMKKIVIRIGLPYITWTGVSYILKMICCRVEGKYIKLGLTDFIIDFILQSEFLWYLGCTIILQVLFYSICFIFRKRKALRIVVLVVSVFLIMFIPMNVYHIQFLWPFYLCGVAFRSIMNRYSEKVQMNRRFYILLIGLTIGCLIVGWNFPTEYTFYRISNQLLGAGAIFDRFFFIICRFTLYFVVTFVVLCWFMLLYKKIKNYRFTELIVLVGRETLFLYVSHVSVLYYILRPVIIRMTEGNGLLVSNPFVRYYVVATVLTMVVLYLLYTISKLVSRNKYMKLFFHG